MENRHAKELSVFQTQSAYYKKSIEALKLELVNHAEAQKIAQTEVNLYKSKLEELKFEIENDRRMQDLHFQKEKELLNEQIKLHKIQLEEITSKHIATMSILESKESIERSLEQALTNATTLKQENDTLKFKLDDLSCRYSAAQPMIENSQVHERTLSGRLHDLERSLSRFDATSVSTNSELCETIYKTFNEEDIQYQLMKHKLEEKIEMERLLIEKVRTLEENLLKTNDELERADLAKKAYEKQLKDMKNTCDKLQQESLTGASMNDDVENDQQKEIENLKLLVEQKETENTRCKKDLIEMMEKTRKLEAQCEQFRDGLVNAWAQCAEYEEKYNQTLAMNDSSKINASMSSTSLFKQFGANDSSDDSHSVADQKKASDPNVIDVGAPLPDDSYPKSDQHQSLYKELQQILESESCLDEIKFKLHRYYAVCEKIAEEKMQLLTENANVSQKPRDGEDPLQKSLNNLCIEKRSLSQDIEDAMNRRKEELESVKTDSAKEINKLRLLLQNIKASIFTLL